MNNLKWLKPAVQATIKKLDKDIKRLYAEAEKIQDQAWAKQDAAKKLRHQKFYLQTGNKVGDFFEYKNKAYKIDSTEAVIEVDPTNLRSYVGGRTRTAPHLVEFLTGASQSPFKLIPPKAK